MNAIVYVCVVATLLVQQTSAKLDLPPAIQELVDTLQKTCIEETGVDEALIEKAKNDHVIEADPKLKCFLKCMMVNMQMLSEDGVFNKEIVMPHIPKEMLDMGAEKVVDTCKDMKGEDACDTAYHLVQCFAKEAQQFAELFE